MAIQIFSLRGVPDDEAEEVRDLLTSQAIDFYETPGGNWGISMPALWLKDETQLETVRHLLDEYQQQRQAQVRHEQAMLRQQGKQRRIPDLFSEQPLRYLLYLLLIVVILYISIRPFVSLSGD